MRPFVACMLACLLGISFGLAGAPAVDAADRDTVTIALTGEPPTMDPHRVSNFIGAMVWRWSYDTLISAETGTGKHLPWLATKWESTDNNKSVKFWLRQDATFSDGTPVTSESIKFAMQRVLSSARQRTYFKSFDHIEILDDHTFIWHNKYPDNGMYNRLSRLAHAISLNVRDKDEATISRTTFGSGPYILKEWTKGNKMVFEANPTWWGNSMYPKRPKTVVLRRLPEATTRVKALLTGEIDVAWGVLPQYIPQVENNPNTKIAAIPAVRIMHMGFFTTHGGPMADVRVRKAINYAIDADLIRRTILGGRADLFGQMLHPWNYSGYNPNKEWYGYDPEKAKALLKEAGYPNGFKMEIIATNGRYPGDKATCEASAGMLKKVGIDATCNSQRFPLFKKLHRAYKSGKRKGAAAYYMGFGNGGGETTLVLRGTSSCDGPWSGMCFPDLDAAIDKAAALTDPKAQQAAFEAVTDMMKEKVTHKIFFKIHDVIGYSARLEFTPRHDETLFPWEIVVKQ
jgi:peptide/nickel transport system substrate-binding protein